MDRRKFIGASGAGLTGLILPSKSGAASRPSTGKSPDVIVVGAGVFGLWTAYKLLGKGLSVLLFDAYGAGNTIGSSGGHTRAIQADADVSTYVRSVLQCYPQWQELERTSYARLLYGVGRLIVGTKESDRQRILSRNQVLLKFGITDTEMLDAAEMKHRWPQMRTDDMLYGLYHSGGPAGSALRADRACQVLGKACELRGAQIKIGHVEPKLSRGRISSVRLQETGETFRAPKYVFACGPWMPNLFPEVFQERTRLEPRVVYFYRPPDGDASLAFPNIPNWSFPENGIYGFPSIENEGFKVAPGYAPDSVPDIEKAARDFTYDRFPSLTGMPVVRVRGCQFTRSIDYAFIIDRHPTLANTFLVGADSGQGFKHGPMVGEHAANMVAGDPLDPEYTALFRINDKKFPAEPGRRQHL